MLPPWWRELADRASKGITTKSHKILPQLSNLSQQPVSIIISFRIRCRTFHYYTNTASFLDFVKRPKCRTFHYCTNTAPFFKIFAALAGGRRLPLHVTMLLNIKYQPMIEFVVGISYLLLNLQGEI